MKVKNKQQVFCRVSTEMECIGQRWVSFLKLTTTHEKVSSQEWAEEKKGEREMKE